MEKQTSKPKAHQKNISVYQSDIDNLKTAREKLNLEEYVSDSEVYRQALKKVANS